MDISCVLVQPYNCSYYKHLVRSVERMKKYGLLATIFENTAGKYFTAYHEYDRKIE